MNNNDVLKQAKDALDLAIKGEQRNKSFMAAIGPAIADALKGALGSQILETMKPFFNKLTDDNAKTNENLIKAIHGLNVNINPEVRIPDIHIPEIKVPTVNVPRPEVTVNVPEIKIPKIEIPATKFPELMKVMMEGIDRTNPLPVLVVDEMGNPFYGGAAGSGGTAGRLVAEITDVRGVSLIDNVTNPAQPTLRTSATVTFPTSSLATVLVDSTGVAYSGSNPVPTTASVSLTAATGPGDGASALRVIQAGDTVSSVIVNSGTITTVTGITNTVMVVGDIASGALEDGSSFPVKIGSRFNSTIPTYTDGQRGDIQMGSRGSLNVTMMAVGSGNALRANDDNTDTVAPTATSDKLTVMARNTVYDSIGNTHSRQVGGAGVTNVGTARVVMATDAVSSVVVNSGTITTVTGITNSLQSSVIDSSGVQYSGSNPFPMTVVTSATASLNVALTDSGGVQYSGSNPVPITGNIGTVTTVTGITNSLAVANIDSSGIQYSGSNPFPMTVVTSATASLNVAMTDSGGVQYSGSNPVPVSLANTGSTINVNLIGGGNDSAFTFMARTTNPTAVADGADVRPKADKLGRTLTRPIQVRDLIATARANVVNGTEATLLAAVASTFLDMISVTAANASTNAVTADFRDVSGAGVAFTLTIPANSTAGIVHAVPYPQGEVNSRWTVDLTDDTHNVTFNALFSKEI